MTTEKKPLQLGSLVKTTNSKTVNKKVDDKLERTAITTKLDKNRFRALKLYALDHQKTSQQVMIEALDLLLSKK